MADECRKLREISGRAVRGDEPTGCPSGLLNHWDAGHERMPVPHDPVTGEPTDEGWRELERVWGIGRPG